jgi:PAS domain S-box-containing protein
MENARLFVDSRGDMSAASELGDLFSRVPVALYRTDEAGDLLIANQALVTLLGYEDLEHLQSNLTSASSVYVDPSDRERWVQEMEEKGLVFDFDVEFKRADGTTIWVQDTARAIKDENGDLMYYEGALIDVSDKVEATKARDQFVATVSHELRNPITAVLGLSRELADRYKDFDEVDRKEMSEMIARQAEDASWLIEDLLVAYRGDVSEVSISLEVFDIVETTTEILEVAPVEVELDVSTESAMVRADPRRSRQIIRNLVNNAINHGGEEIVVRVTHDESWVKVRVCDNGEAISEEDVTQIFEAFKTGSRPRHPSSVGLGLPVARQLARLMGGDVTYRHQEGNSVFTLKLPAA